MNNDNKFKFDYETAGKNYVSQKNSEQRLWEKAYSEKHHIVFTVDKQNLTKRAKEINDALKRVFE